MQKQKLSLIVGIAIGTMLGLVIGGYVLRKSDITGSNYLTQVSPKLAMADVQKLLPEERNTVEVFQSEAPAIVFITNSAMQMDFFSMKATEVPQGSGSGFIWDKNGHVVTNYHVIANANSLSVTLNDGSNFPAKIVGAEPNKDIAVLKITAS